MPVCINIKTPGVHSQHAVVVDHAYKQPRHMRAVNSWGADQPFIDVTAENFVYAIDRG
jgi:hypothetical protein